MNQATKYALGVVVGFGLGVAASHFVTMHYMEKFINYTFTSMEGSDAIQIIHALNRIREGKTESAIVVLEHNMSSKLIPIAHPRKNLAELSESEVKASKMAVEYWNKFPEAKGQELIRSEIENIANGK